MYVITYFDVYNDSKNTKKLCKPIHCRTLQDIDAVQEKIQLKQRKKHGEDTNVLVHYKHLNSYNPESEHLFADRDKTKVQMIKI